MMCPMKLAILANPALSNYVEKIKEITECEGKECAWWNEKEECCGIKIGAYLADIASEIRWS